MADAPTSGRPEALWPLFTDLTKLFIPVLFYMLGAFVSLIQAFVFTLLTVIYVSLAIGHGDDHHH